LCNALLSTGSCVSTTLGSSESWTITHTTTKTTLLPDAAHSFVTSAPLSSASFGHPLLSSFVSVDLVLAGVSSQRFFEVQLAQLLGCVRSDLGGLGIEGFEASFEAGDVAVVVHVAFTTVAVVSNEANAFCVLESIVNNLTLFHALVAVDASYFSTVNISLKAGSNCTSCACPSPSLMSGSSSIATTTSIVVPVVVVLFSALVVATIIVLRRRRRHLYVTGFDCAFVCCSLLSLLF